MSDKFKMAFEQLLAAIEENLSDMKNAFNARNRFAFQGQTLEAYQKLAQDSNKIKAMMGQYHKH